MAERTILDDYLEGNVTFRNFKELFEATKDLPPKTFLRKIHDLDTISNTSDREKIVLALSYLHPFPPAREAKARAEWQVRQQLTFRGAWDWVRSQPTSDERRREIYEEINRLFSETTLQSLFLDPEFSSKYERFRELDNIARYSLTGDEYKTFSFQHYRMQLRLQTLNSILVRRKYSKSGITLGTQEDFIKTHGEVFSKEDLEFLAQFEHEKLTDEFLEFMKEKTRVGSSILDFLIPPYI